MNRLIYFITAFICMSLLFYACSQKNITATKWSLAGTLPQSLGVAGAVAGINNNVLVVAGGSNFPNNMPWLGGKKKYYSEGYIFKKTNKDSLVFYTSFHLPFSISYAANCSTPEAIIAAGGENESGISNKVFSLQWNNARDTISIKNLPALPFAVTNAAITCRNNTIYLAGGETKNGISDKFLLLDLNDTGKGWQQLPHLPHAVSHAVMVTQSNGIKNCIYLIGGRKKNNDGISDLYAYTFAFDISKNQWQQKQSLPYALSAGTGVAAGENYILLFGGDKGETFHNTEKIIAAINKENDSLKKENLNEAKIKLQSSHPGFSKEVLLYNTINDKWTAIDSIPFHAPVTTMAIKWNDEIFIPGGEIKAGVRTPQILSAKIIAK
jgi:cyclically-permuted mutarotase family protein